MAPKELSIIVRVKDFASKTLTTIGSRFGSFTRKLIKFPFNLIATGFKRIAQVGLLAISFALGKATIDAIAFEKEFKKVVTLLDEASFEDVGLSLEKGIKFLEQDAVAVMEEFGFSVRDVNKALFDTISAGVPAGEAIAFLRESSKLAIAGVADLSIATDGMTSVFNVFKGELKSVNQISRAFFTAQKFGKTTVAALAANIGKVAPIAKAAGISLEELLAVTAQLTLGGLSTEEATTALRQSIAALIQPSEQAKKVFQDLGIPFGSANLAGGKLAETLGILAEKSQGNADVLSQLIPNIRAFTGLAALDAKALANLDRITKALVEDTTSLDRAFEEQFDTFDRQLRVFQGNITGIAKEITDVFLPKITELLTKFNDMAPEFKKNSLIFVADLRIFFSEVITETKIASEKVKEFFGAPFRIETYKKLFPNFKAQIAKMRTASDKVNKDIIENFDNRQKKELTTEEDFHEGINLIRIAAAEKQEEIRRALNERLAELDEIERRKKILKDLAEVDANKAIIDAKKAQHLDFLKFLDFVNKEQLEKSKEFISFMVAGVRSGNILVSSIAKAAALFDIAVKTRVAAMNAFSSVPWPFNFAAAGAAIAFGAEQAAAVAGAKPQFHEGGIVQGGSGQDVDITAKGGEAVLTGDQQARFMDIAEGISDAPGGQSADLSISINVDGKVLAETVVEGYNRARDLDLVPKLTTD